MVVGLVATINRLTHLPPPRFRRQGIIGELFLVEIVRGITRVIFLTTKLDFLLDVSPQASVVPVLDGRTRSPISKESGDLGPFLPMLEDIDADDAVFLPCPRMVDDYSRTEVVVPAVAALPWAAFGNLQGHRLPVRGAHFGNLFA